jgi:hypothetical protein
MTAFTLIHVLLSLVGIASGLIVVLGMLAAKRLDGLTALFLATTVLTSVTGFFFPYRGFKPSYAVGVLSMIALAIAIFARYSRRMAGPWLRTYAITSVIALYFNVFVLIVQLFEKVPALKAMAPTQSEPPFKFTHLVVLVLFIALGIGAARRFRAAE